MVFMTENFNPLIFYIAINFLNEDLFKKNTNKIYCLEFQHFKFHGGLYFMSELLILQTFFDIDIYGTKFARSIP